MCVCALCSTRAVIGQIAQANGTNPWLCTVATRLTHPRILKGDRFSGATYQHLFVFVCGHMVSVSTRDRSEGGLAIPYE